MIADAFVFFAIVGLILGAFGAGAPFESWARGTGAG
jgi:hypothetical protein